MLNYFYENIESNLNFNGLYRYIVYVSSRSYIGAPGQQRPPGILMHLIACKIIRSPAVH